MRLKCILLFSMVLLLTSCSSDTNENSYELSETVSVASVEIIETSSETILEESINEESIYTSLDAGDDFVAETVAESIMLEDTNFEILPDRTDLRAFEPFSREITLVDEETVSFSAETPRLSEMNEISYMFVNFTFDNEKIIDLLDKAFDVFYYNIKRENWGHNLSEQNIDGFYATGISYKSFYDYMSQVFTENLISKMENGEWNHHGNQDSSKGYCDFKQIDGELFVLKPAEGNDPGYEGIVFSIQEENNEKIIISGIKYETNSTQDGTDEINCPDMFTILKTTDGLRLDSFELWY